MPELPRSKRRTRPKGTYKCIVPGCDKDKLSGVSGIKRHLRICHPQTAHSFIEHITSSPHRLRIFQAESSGSEWSTIDGNDSPSIQRSPIQAQTPSVRSPSLHGTPAPSFSPPREDHLSLELEPEPDTVLLDDTEPGPWLWEGEELDPEAEDSGSPPATINYHPSLNGKFI